MALKKRERILVWVTGGLAVLLLGQLLLSGGGTPRRVLRAQRDKLAEETATMKRQIERGNEAEKQLGEWGRRALPSNLEAARSSYQNWLLAVSSQSGWSDTKVEASPGRQRGTAFRALRFTVQSQANLSALTRFLERFYATGYLHQILNVNVVPIEGGDRLDLQVTIEALSLPGADRVDRLPEPLNTPAEADTLKRYARAVADRNVFAFYRPPAPPLPPRVEPKFDAAKFVYLTAIVAVGDQHEVWIVNRTTGEQLKLREGDSFSVGEIRGTVRRIGQREAEVEIDGRRWRFPIGDNLRELIELPGA